MRGSLVVLALAVTPLVARVSRAQDDRRDDRRETRVASRDRDDDKDKDQKCKERKRGEGSERAREVRADPRDRGNKDCAPPPAPQPPPTQPPPTQPPPTQPPPPPAPADTGTTSISGYLFHDLNQNGIFDADEIGLAGWTVQVTGPVTQSTLSDGNGFYSFTALPAGNYTLCVVPPAGWNQTLPLSGTACPNNSFGYTITAPALVGDTAYSDQNFGFLSALLLLL
jgi:hypothetical protein